MPILFLCHAAAYLDRVNLSFAQRQLQDDLAFSDTVYGIGAAMFFISGVPRSVHDAGRAGTAERAEARMEP